MRILEVIPDLSLQAGGPPVSVISNGSALAKLGHEVMVATTNAYGEQLDMQMRTGAAHAVRTFQYWPPARFAFSPGLTGYLRKEIPAVDVVIMHGLYVYPTMAASHLCRFFGIPYIIEPHGALDPYLYKRHRYRKAVMEFLFQDRATRNASAFWFSSDEEARLAQPFILGSPWFVAPHVIDLAPFAVCRDRMPFEDAFGRSRILFYGRVNFKKGLDLLIRACGLLRQRGVKFELVIVGPIDDEMRPRLKEWEQQAGIADAVRYLGSVAGDRRIEALSDATVFALPSYSENFGIAVMEAIAAGLPVVISDQVNIHREISDAKVGWVTRCDPQEIADALQSAICDKAANKSCRDNTRDFVTSRYSTTSNALVLESKIRETIERFRSKRRHALKGP